MTRYSSARHFDGREANGEMICGNRHCAGSKIWKIFFDGYWKGQEPMENRK